ncbi:MAG: PIN domain-containing protein [Bacteroidetes bacterium]|nr:PIN domain-containing protein [Bacteroidota bacterium]MDF1865822.1 hypothetical protein [Saprospiraceae bacterium]
MNRAFPNAFVDSFEHLIKTIELPDKDDRHVVAAAIHSNTDFIVTFNLRDFPNDYLKEFELVAIPDEFVCELFNLDRIATQNAFNNQLASLQKPPKTKEELVEILKNCGLINSSKLF